MIFVNYINFFIFFENYLSEEWTNISYISLNVLRHIIMNELSEIILLLLLYYNFMIKCQTLNYS